MAEFGFSAKVDADVSGFQKGMQKAEKSLKGFADGISNIGKKGIVGGLANVTLAMGGVVTAFKTATKIVKDVAKAVNECTEAYKKQAMAERTLQTAIQNNPYVSGASLDALRQFASEMQKVTNYGDEQILALETQLISLGRTEEETMKIIKVATDMASSGTMSLDTAITQLNATLNGNIGRLGQQNAELKNLSEEELKSGKAVEILGEKFKGLASATIDTSQQLKNIKGDFKEAIGQFTLPTSDMWNRFWAGFYEKGISVIKQFDEYLDRTIIGKSISEELIKGYKSITDERQKILYVEDNIHLLTESQLKALENHLLSVKHRNKEEELLLNKINQEKEAQIYLAKIYQEMDEAEAEKQRNLDAQKQIEDDIVKLKEDYLKKVAEQEAKWENIKIVTGEEVKAEEKLKFYQDALVDVMTQAGGKITTNNQLYKDQIKIINALKESLGVVEEVIEETSEQVEEDTEQYKTLFQLIEEGFQKALEKQRQMTEDWSSFADNTLTTLIDSFSDMFILIGQSLVDDSVGFKDFASVAIKSIQEILKGLSAQLTALATISFVTGQYANAMKATAGATMALVASGTLGGVAKRMQEVSSATEEANGSLEQFKANLDAIYSGEYSKKSGTFFAGISAVQREINALRKEADEVYKIASSPYETGKMATPSGLKRVRLNNKRNKEIDEARENYLELVEAITEATKEMMSSIEEFAKQSKEVVNANKTTIESYRDYYSALRLFDTYSQMTIDDADKLKYALIANGIAIGDITTTMTFQLEKYKVLSETLLDEIKANAQSLAISFYESFSNIGKNLGEMIFNNILDGAGETSFLENIKAYIRKNMLQIAIYTEGFAEQLSEIGGKLMSALMGGGRTNVSEYEEVKQELLKLYEDTAKKAKDVDYILSIVFEDIDNTISDSVDESIKKLTEFEQAMEDLLESIQDLGGDIASQISQGLTDGLSQSDFLNNMKNWLRNMMIQMVVYTDTMKVEVEEIGKRISKGLIDGFTQTDLHEIRRDLSYLFEQASSKVSTIDSMLGSVFAYADGTNNASRGIALVGEAGPELVKFNGGEQVLNNRNTQKLIADKNNTASTFNVNFYQTRDTTAFAMMSQLKQYQRQMVFNGVL